MVKSDNLDLAKTLTRLKVISILAGLFVICATVYASLDNRVDSLEKTQDVIIERSKNTNEKINMIYEIVKTWERKNRVAINKD